MSTAADRYSSLVLSLGASLVGLLDASQRATLVESLRSGDLAQAYVEVLRDELSAVLAESTGADGAAAAGAKT